MNHNEEIHVSVDSTETAARLQEEFDELIARVNVDLMSCSMQPDDPISVEAAIAFAERSLDHQLQTFADNTDLQALAPEIKARFREAIQQQALSAARR